MFSDTEEKAPKNTVKFKKKNVKGKAKSRTRASEDFSGVSLFKTRARTDSPDPQKAVMLSRISKYGSLRDVEDEKGGTMEGDIEGVIVEGDIEGDIVEGEGAKAEDGVSSRFSQLNHGTQTFLLRESHFREAPVLLRNEYGSDDEQKQAVDELEDVDMDDAQAYADVRKATHDHEFYDLEIVSISGDETAGGVKVLDLVTVAETITSLKDRLVTLRGGLASKTKRLQEVETCLEEAITRRSELVGEL